MKLTTQQLRFFRDLGYLRLPDRVDDDLVGQLGEIIRTGFSRLPAGARDEKLYALYEQNAVAMDRLVRHSAILDSLRPLLGQHIVFLTNRHNCGMLHSAELSGSPRLHRDVLQWSRPLVTVLVYLEDSSVENGCTQVIPGSHLIPFVESGQTGGTWMDEHEQYADLAQQALPIPMVRGSLLALDATVFHAAGRNESRRTRMCIALAYRSVDELDVYSSAQRTVLVSGEYVYRGNDAVARGPGYRDSDGSVTRAQPASRGAIWRS